MRRFHTVLATLALVATPLFAQNAAPGAAPAATPQRAPDASPPPMVPVEEGEPQVTIRQREGATIQEYRLNGRLYKIVVTPDKGVPYTLIDQRGDGSFVPQEGPGTPQLSVPMWVIGTF